MDYPKKNLSGRIYQAKEKYFLSLLVLTAS